MAGKNPSISNDLIDMMNRWYYLWKMARSWFLRKRGALELEGQTPISGDTKAEDQTAWTEKPRTSRFGLRDYLSTYPWPLPNH